MNLETDLKNCMATPLNPTVLDHIQLAEYHLQEAQHMICKGGPKRPKAFRMKLEQAKQIIARLHVKEIQYINACLSSINEGQKYNN